MFKDFNKYLSTSLKVYMFVLVLVFILKLIGLDYFGLNTDNNLIMLIDKFVLKFRLTNIYYLLTLYIYTIFILCLIFKRNDKEIKIISLIYTIIGIIVKVIESKIGLTYVNCLIDATYLLSMIAITNIKYKQSKVIKRAAIVLMINFFYQFITFVIRGVNYTEQNSFTLNVILNIDYLLMLLITYKLYFMKGGFKLCGTEVGYYLLTKKSFSNLQKDFQENSSNFKKLNKQDKATFIIYSVLSIIWNIATVMVVLFIAKINKTLIECIFILSSFWISKKTFGKPFHLKSKMWCFILSNITYYVLNRVTAPIGISILVPILLGVGLSYVTSKLVKKTYKPLYRGMPEEEFEETIQKVTTKGSDKYNICYDFFIKKQNAILLGRKYNYTESGIRKITGRINEKIKALN